MTYPSLGSVAQAIAPPKPHPRFSSTGDTDIVIKSSDNILFYLHRKNLEVHTGAFPPFEFVAFRGEVTHLTETADVLAVMFDFVYPRRQPALEDMPFQIVAPVAEAVEKYEVFSAMKVCEFRLRDFVQTHAVEVLGHAIRHDYPKLRDGAIPHLARLPLLDVLNKLPIAYAIPWCRYHEAWNDVFRRTITHIRKPPLAFHFSSIDESEYARCSAIDQILRWQDLNSLGALNTALSEAMGIPASKYQPRLGNFSPELNMDPPRNLVQKAAKLCQEGIAAMPSFSEFLKSE